MKFFMSIEKDSIQGVLIKNQSLILDPDIQQELEQKGYGEMEKNKLLLKPFESLYLLYTDKLKIFKGKKKKLEKNQKVDMNLRSKLQPGHV